MKEREFQELIREIVSSEEFRTMRAFRHHVRTNVFDHSLKVAYLCYRHHKRFQTKLPLYELVRGALLHDYYLYDWHDRRPSYRWVHGFAHPKRALKNALRRYPDLSITERDMILRHMFPLTVSPPRTRGGWILCLYDKIAAVDEYLSRSHRQTTASRKQ